MTSRSPISLASLMNDPTPPPQPQSQSPQSQSQPRSQFPTTTTQTSMQQQSQEPSLQQSDSKKTLLSTSSPEGIQVASKITPTRLANLLIRKGPLPIRHITSQLALEVPSFELLSLSKQRRLIMAAMEQTDTVNNVVFEKIGWGQWAVRKIDSDYIVTEGTEKSSNANTSGSSGNGSANEKLINVNDLRNQLNLKLGWSKKKKLVSASAGAGSGAGLNSRRESITNHVKSLHNIKLPNESIDNAIASESSDDDDDDDQEGIDEYALSDTESSDEEMFAFDEKNRASSSVSNPITAISEHTVLGSPPIKFARRVPIKISPPPEVGAINGSGNMASSASRRRKSSSSVSNSITKPYRQHLFNTRSRLNSIENLDNYIVSSAKNSSVLISSPPPPISFSSSPATSVAYDEHYNLNQQQLLLFQQKLQQQQQQQKNQRRKSSFNESHVRSTLSNVKTSSDDTDEEDWAAMGPESLRKNRKNSIPAALRNDIDSSGVDEEEKSAAFALVDLMSV